MQVINSKDKIREEFKYIKEILDFDRSAHEIFRNWYVDGRLYYLKVIDQKTTGRYTRFKIY